MAVEIKMKSKADSDPDSEFKPYTINGYLISKPFTSNDSGFSKWGFCTKYGKEFFIKEFLDPKYPSADAEISETRRKNQIKECEEWFAQHSKVYKTIMNCNGGNMIVPIDFFKDKNNFYLVTEKVEANNIGFNEIHKKSLEQKHILMMIIANEFSRLEAKGVIHSDIKPNNLMFKSTINDFFTVKIIDFDSSFLESNVPYSDDIHGDLVYFSPETILYIDSEGEEGVITAKADVFSIGIIFHELLCGSLPEIESDNEYSYIGEAVLNGEKLILNNQISKEYREIIEKMLIEDPDERISMKEVFNSLYDMININKKNNDKYKIEKTDPIKSESNESKNTSPWKIATFD